MRVVISVALVLLFGQNVIAAGITGGFEECPAANVPVSSLIDCKVNPYTKENCISLAAECQWCGTHTGSTPKCFIPLTFVEFPQLVPLFAAAHCTVGNCPVRINCHPDWGTVPGIARVTQGCCEARGCLWIIGSGSQPACVYYDNPDTTYITPYPYDEVACTNCATCTDPENCLFNEQPHIRTERRCEREGCQWCASNSIKCQVGGGETNLFQLQSNCNSCADCPTNAYIVAANQAICEGKGGTWCSGSCRTVKGKDCTDCASCEIQVPRFQKVDFTILPGRPPYIQKLLEVLCVSQRGLWCPATTDKCLSASSYGTGMAVV